MTQQKPTNFRVLLAAHIGEPRGGISTYYEAILNSDLKKHVNLHFVETSKGFSRFGDRGNWKLTNWFNALENIVRYLFTLVFAKPDLVHIGTAYGASFAKHSMMVCFTRMFFIPIIIQPHCSFFRLIPENTSWWRKYVLFIFRQCKGIIILSKEWEVLAGLIPNLKIRYIPNAINLKPYIQLLRPRENTDGRINILYLGHIHRDKGLLDLVQAAAIMSKNKNLEFNINIVGETYSSDEFTNINDLITSNNLQGSIVIFEPEYGEKKIDRIASTDILVLPSYHEGMPISIIEAMAAGLPVVASNVGGIPDLIEDNESGLLIDPGDVQALSTALSELIQSPEKRLAMGTVGRQRAVQEFDIERNVDSLISFYQEILINFSSTAS